jgi:peroxiredoxin
VADEGVEMVGKNLRASGGLHGVIFILFAGIAVIPGPLVVAQDGVEMPPVLLQMLRNDVVHAQMGLTESEIAKVNDVLNRVDGPWWRSRNMQDAERIETVASLTELVREELRTIISKRSFERLEQLQRQALGTRMFLLDDVARELSLSPVTVNKMASIAKETDLSLVSLTKRAQAGEDADAIAKERAELSAKEQTAIVGLLTNGQKQRISELTGERFDFAKVTRTLPRAPELTQTADQWLQGSPTSLADLQGKVVAIHFYAFQCINCQRNLPHYSAWHKDYADKGLVVIGVQTPETPSEREPSKVAAAIKSENIAYPVLMDADSANWQNWGTTMWPTVYLIDRQGFIRTWWQGEMNWQGNPGEQKMRDHIERLLSEK